MSLGEILEIGRKIVVVLGPLLVAVWTVIEYLDTQEKERAAQKTQFEQSLAAQENDRRRSREEREKELATLEWEARRPFLERQMALCFEAAATASTLATTTDKAKWGNARDRFWELYWGELALVENGAVAKKMVDFGKTLKNVSVDNLPIVNLQRPSLHIASECRGLIGASWQVELRETSRGDGGP